MCGSMEEIKDVDVSEILRDHLNCKGALDK